MLDIIEDEQEVGRVQNDDRKINIDKHLQTCFSQANYN
jgi:hypothetical protein